MAFSADPIALLIGAVNQPELGAPDADSAERATVWTGHQRIEAVPDTIRSTLTSSLSSRFNP